VKAVSDGESPQDIGFSMWVMWTKRIVLVLSLSGLAGCGAFEGPRLHVQGTEALERGEYSEARDALSRAAVLVEHPSQASQVQNHLGLAYLGEGDKALAEQSFRRAIDLDCRNEAAQHNLEVVLRRPGDTVGNRQAEELSRGELQ
jgi:Tfp pilus assembly protein PilF